MATKTKNWSTGTGSATIQFGGQGDGEIIITSDANSLYEARSMQITVETTDGSGIQRIVNINQAAKQRIDLSAAVVTTSNQTYNGSAKTPTPTVTLNGSTVPITGYDVSYSNNTNAGTATITIAGKGDYTGVAYGTFTIAKASRTLIFADSYMVMNTSSTGTKTATPSAGSGDGAITYSIANTTYATINSSTGAVTSKTSDGSVTVTATIAEGTNYLSASASYTLYVFATTHNYSYNGSYRSVTLPPGTYQFQVWGAQGGSNGTNSTYGITAKAGGKGGYSVGQLTISQATGVRVYVGGQGTSSAGGYNGGGGNDGNNHSYYNADNELGTSYYGGGGGASDIRLSDGSLYSRMIVAGGGSGGTMCCRKVTTESYSWESYSYSVGKSNSYMGSNPCQINSASGYFVSNLVYLNSGDVIKVSCTAGSGTWSMMFKASTSNLDTATFTRCLAYESSNPTQTYTVTSSGYYGFSGANNAVSVQKRITTSSTTTDTSYQVGYAGGGTTGDGYSTAYTYYGGQSSAGIGGSFGVGATQYASSYRYCSGAGGGGWYGGGSGYSNTDITAIKRSGGGSGWVNTSSSAGNRPSGYTGLELDSGTTYAGDTSFPAPGGGNETGHSGDGYIRITRIS